MGRNRVLRDDGLFRNLDAGPFGLPNRLLLQVVYLMQKPLDEQSFKKIGQNRFHDPAPQTRGFLTSNYYAVKRPLSIPWVFGCTRIDRERRYPRCWKEGLPEPSLEDPRDEVVRRGYYGVARVPVAVQSCRPAPCLAVSPF